jgi:hypothetical protein
MYCNDHVYNGFMDNKDLYERINASRKVMVLNYQLGKAGVLPWTFGWDRYLFLNTKKEEALKKRIQGASTKALPPPVDLSEFLLNKPDYNTNLRLIRHSSQGDNKYPKHMPQMIQKMIDLRPDIEFRLMPAPTFLPDNPHVHKHQRNMPEVIDFLKLGNCFWYHLPKDYEDQGPRVIMEAQASGLPVICDNHSGPSERVNSQNGWLCNSPEDYFDVIRSITPEILKEKGELSRKWASVEYNPNNWIREIMEGK